ncbi:HEAT repeat domain-containing protein [Candidatus Riflebacteria bacterium]
MKLETFRNLHQKEKREIMAKVFLAADDEKLKILQRLSEIACPEDYAKIQSLNELAPHLQNKIADCLAVIQNKFPDELKSVSKIDSKTESDSGKKTELSGIETLEEFVLQQPNASFHQVSKFFFSLWKNFSARDEKLAKTKTVNPDSFLALYLTATEEYRNFLAEEVTPAQKISAPVFTEPLDYSLIEEGNRRRIHCFLGSYFFPFLKKSVRFFFDENVSIRQSGLTLFLTLIPDKLANFLFCQLLLLGKSCFNQLGYYPFPLHLKEKWARLILKTETEDLYFILPTLLSHTPADFFQNILGLYTSTDSQIRFSVLEILKNYPSELVEKPFKTFIRDYDEALALKALQIVEERSIPFDFTHVLNVARAEKREKVRSKLAKLLIGKATDADLSDCSFLFYDKDTRVVANCIEGLWQKKISFEEFLKNFKDLLQVKNNRIQANLVILLFNAGQDTRASLIFKKMLQSKDKWFRASAAFVLRKIKPLKTYKSQISFLLSDEDQGVRRITASSLKENPMPVLLDFYWKRFKQAKEQVKLSLLECIFSVINAGETVKKSLQQELLDLLSKEKSNIIKECLVKNFTLLAGSDSLILPLLQSRDARVKTGVLQYCNRSFISKETWQQIKNCQGDFDHRIRAVLYKIYFASGHLHEVMVDLMQISPVQLQSFQAGLNGFLLFLNSLEEETVRIAPSYLKALPSLEPSHSGEQEKISESGVKATAKKSEPTALQKLAARSNLNFKEGRFREAAAGFKKIATHYPEDPRWIFALIQCALKMKSTKFLPQLLPRGIKLARAKPDRKIEKALQELHKKIYGVYL